MSLFRYSLLGGAFLALSPVASAAITFHEVAHWDIYNQTSAAAPVTPAAGLFTARVISNVANEVTTGQVTLPGGQVRAMNPSGSTVSAYSQGGFASGAAAVAAFGSGTYTFQLNAGPFNGAVDSVNYANPGWADAVPYLTNYDALQAMDVNQSFTMEWGNYGANGDHTSLVTYLYVTDLTSNVQVFGGQAPQAGFTSRTFAAGTFVNGHQYRYQLYFGALTQSPTAGGFTGSKRTAATYTTVTGFFAPVPEPATFVLLGLGAAAVARRRRSTPRS